MSDSFLKDLSQKLSTPYLYEDLIPDREASVLLIFQKNPQWEILMIKRVEKEGDPWSGHYAFPGGMRSREDQDQFETALRESHEEVNFNYDEIPHQFLGKLDQLQIHKNGKPIPFLIHPFVVFLEEPFEVIPEVSEVQDYFWFSLEEIIKKENLHNKEFEFLNSTWELPCISIEEHTVWGISYMILFDLMKKWQGLSFKEDLVIETNHWPEYPRYNKYYKRDGE